jgi:DNA polymerase-3 subunit gamma/tau
LLHHQWHTNFETVQALISGQRERVYDLEVADNHNFVANGLLVHNCHMLSSAAFNALLKTLEEPPDRVVFVLATTDPQRVLPTIISRCQRFDFRRIPLEAMAAHLRQIATQEAIEITDEAIALVAQIAQGGLRDAESLLDQLSLLPETITSEAVWDLVGAVPEQDLLDLARAIAQNNAETVLDQARKLMNRGREPLIVLQSLAGFYRDLLIAKTAPSRHDLVAITEATWSALCEFASQLELPTLLRSQQHLRSSELQVKNTTQPRLWLEVTLLGLLPSALGSPSASAAVLASPEATASVTAPILTAVKPATTVASPPSAPPTPAAETPAPLTPVAESSIAPEVVSVSDPCQLDLSQTWQRVLNNIELRSTQMLLRQQGTLERCDRHQALIRVTNQWLGALQRKQTIIAAAFERVLGHPIEVRIESGGTVNTSPLSEAPSQPEPQPKPQSSLATAAGAQSRSVTLAPTIAKPPETPPDPPEQLTPEALAPTPAPASERQPVSASGISTQLRPEPGIRPVPVPEPTEPAAALEPIAPVPTVLPSETGVIAPTDIPLANRESWDIDPGLRAAQNLAQFFNGTVVSEQDLASEASGNEAAEGVGEP